MHHAVIIVAFCCPLSLKLYTRGQRHDDWVPWRWELWVLLYILNGLKLSGTKKPISEHYFREPLLQVLANCRSMYSLAFCLTHNRVTRYSTKLKNQDISSLKSCRRAPDVLT